MHSSTDRTRRVILDPDGPLLVEGPVEVVDESGAVSVSRRFCVAICRCRRSRTYPWCDTSHRQRGKPDAERPTADSAEEQGGR